jgi:hypothetical protein
MRDALPQRFSSWAKIARMSLGSSAPKRMAADLQ